MPRPHVERYVVKTYRANSPSRERRAPYSPRQLPDYRIYVAPAKKHTYFSLFCSPSLSLSLSLSSRRKARIRVRSEMSETRYVAAKLISIFDGF